MSQINQRGIGDGMMTTTSSSSSPISNPSSASASLNPPPPSMMGVIGSITLNIAASVGTIFINKHLFQNLGFVGLGTTLTVFHFVFCFVFTGLTAVLGVFQPKRLPLLKVLPISLAFCGYVVFNNISLAYNSVSFYQVMKIMCTPCIILIEYFFYRKTPDRRILFPLIPVCVGTFITVFTDLEMNYYGTVMAVLAVLTNSMYTIYGTEKQKELKANSLQILLYQSIMSAVILSVTIPFFDDMEVLPEYDFRDTNNLFWIIFSCVTAFFVNVSFFLVAGKTSPLSVNVVGYFKTVLVFIGGIMLFTDIVSAKNLLGVTLTLVGVAWYTYEKYKITQESILVLPTTNK